QLATSLDDPAIALKHRQRGVRPGTLAVVRFGHVGRSDPLRLLRHAREPEINRVEEAKKVGRARCARRRCGGRDTGERQENQQGRGFHAADHSVDSRVMKYRTLGKSGLRLSEIGTGAWAMGGSMW